MRTLAEILMSTSGALFPEGLGEHPVRIDSVGTTGDTPLHALCWRDDTEAASRLIEAGADVNAIGEMEETPLHVAIRRENRELIRLLTAAGARWDATSGFGESAGEMARARGLRPPSE